MALISDEELQNRLEKYLTPSSIPPIVDATRILLQEKLKKLEKANFQVDFKPEIEIQANKESEIVIQANKDQIQFKTLVFFDCEATGLPSDTLPPRITEICFKALDVEHFLSLEPLLEMYK